MFLYEQKRWIDDGYIFIQRKAIFGSLHVELLYSEGMEVENKIEELTLQEIKQNLIALRPDIATNIDSLTQKQIRQEYLQTYNACQFETDKGENINYLDMEQIDKQMLNEDKTVKMEQEDDKTNYSKRKMPDLEVIRQQLIYNLPEMKEQIKKFDHNELYEVYNEFIMVGKSQTNPQLIEMIQTILSVYPNMRDKIVNFSQIQIHKLYDSCKGHRSYKNTPINITNNSVRQNKSMVSSSKQKKPLSIPIMKKPIKAPQIISSHFDRQQIQLIAPIAEGKRQKKSYFTYKSGSLPQVVDEDNGNVNYNGPKKAYHDNNFNYSQPNKNGSQFWQMNHKDSNLNVKARTYVMIHTEYQNPNRKGQKVDSIFDKCNCFCCKNNTVQNMFRQIIQRIESSKH